MLGVVLLVVIGAVFGAGLLVWAILKGLVVAVRSLRKARS